MADTNSHGNVSLREAVCRSLRAQGGLQLLREPPRFLGCVLDMVDPNAQTTHVFKRNCDEVFLRPFAEGANAGTGQALHDAAMRATGILVEKRFIQPDIAERVACEMSLALCDFVGVSPSDRVRAAATREGQAPPDGEGMPGAGGVRAFGLERGHADAGRPVEPEPEPKPQPQREGIGGASVSGVERGYAHTGSPIEPEPRVELGGRVLEKGRDYRLRYRDNVGGRSGTSQGYIDIVGIGGYQGTKSVPFAIEAKGGRKSPLLVAAAVAVMIALAAAIGSQGYTRQLPESTDSDAQTADSKAGAEPSDSDAQTADSKAGAEPSDSGAQTADSKARAEPSDRYDVVAVSAGDSHTVALLGDGTVVATENIFTGSDNISGWHDIAAVSAGGAHTVGLLRDGTVVATGRNYEGQCDVSGWRDVVAVSAGNEHTVALLGDGTLVATGSNSLGQCDVSGWRDVGAVSAGGYHTVALLGDGTVVATGSGAWGDVSGWHDVAAVSAGYSHTVALLNDGTVVATGNNEHGECDVSGWRDVVAVSAGCFYTIALLGDGTVVATGDNEHGQCDVSGWRDVVAVSAGNEHTVALLGDGTVVATGSNRFSQCDVSGW